jgi:hypothetical protein
MQNQPFALDCEGKQKGQRRQKRQNFRHFCYFYPFCFRLPFTVSHDFKQMYPGIERFAALTGASPRPYTPRFANARRFFTVGNKENF